MALLFSTLVRNEVAGKKILHSCYVYGCRNRMGKQEGLGFFRFSVKTRRERAEMEVDQGCEKKGLVTHEIFVNLW